MTFAVDWALSNNYLSIHTPTATATTTPPINVSHLLVTFPYTNSHQSHSYSHKHANHYPDDFSTATTTPAILIVTRGCCNWFQQLVRYNMNQRQS